MLYKAYKRTGKTKADFDNIFEWQLYKSAMQSNYDKDNKGNPHRHNKFYWLHDKDLVPKYRKPIYRKLVLLEHLCNVLYNDGRLPQPDYISKEDFIVHYRLFGDTYRKTCKQIEEDLLGIDRKVVLNKLFDDDITVVYQGRVSNIVSRYIDKGYVNVLNRFKGTPNKILRTEVKNSTLNLPSVKNLAIIRDRKRFYKDLYNV